jgi:hypothetical protein
MQNVNIFILIQKKKLQDLNSVVERKYFQTKNMQL